MLGGERRRRAPAADGSLVNAFARAGRWHGVHSRPPQASGDQGDAGSCDPNWGQSVSPPPHRCCLPAAGPPAAGPPPLDSALGGLRDRALMGVMIYSFARVLAAGRPRLLPKVCVAEATGAQLPRLARPRAAAPGSARARDVGDARPARRTCGAVVAFVSTPHILIDSSE